MKKLLVLVLILSLASLANAALVWTISGSTTTQDTETTGYDVNPGDTITLALSSTNKTAGGINIDILTDNGSDGAMTAASVHANLVNGNAGISVADLDALLVSYEMDPSGYDTDDWAMVSAASGGTMVAVNATIFSLSYTVGEETGAVTINGIAVAGEVWEQNLNEVTLTGGNETTPVADLWVVPEPATIALLCLGGLLIRKK